MFRAFSKKDQRSAEASDRRAGDRPTPSERPDPSPGLSMWQRFGNTMTPMWKRVGDAISPRVVQPTERTKGWTTGEVISTFDLTHYERVRLNAMEERVLPPYVRIKIVFAQANAGDREGEIEANVTRLDGLVRTLALYGILERNALDSSKSEKLAPDRENQLGKMLVAAVQLELFQMLDDICEAGDVENDLFDDLCSDAIQEGRRTGFVHLAPDVLLAPGSGYKRLLQIRKDQIVEDIANASGLRAFAGYDCQREPSPPATPRDEIMRIECGSLGRSSLPRLKIGGSASTTDGGGVAPSPSSHVVDSFSPSPTSGHHRTRTQRVRDLLLSIDGLMMESEEALVRLPPLSPDGVRYDAAGAGAVILADRNKRQSTGAADDSDDRDERAGRDSLRTPPDRNADELDGPSPGKRTFFPHEKTWGGIAPFPATPPKELSTRVSSVAGGAAEGLEDGVEYSDKLLAEVDWLIAGTEAALGGVTPEVINGDAATFDKGGAIPVKSVNGRKGHGSLEGANADERGDEEAAEQAAEGENVGVETATVTGDDAGLVSREKDAKVSEVGVPSFPPEASLTDVSLDTVPSPKARESDASRTERESRGSEQTLSPDGGNGALANKKQTPTVVRGEHFAREKEATAILTSGGDASAATESVGSLSLAVSSMRQEGAGDGSEGVFGVEVAPATIEREKGRATMPNVNAVVKTVGENGGPSWGERRAPQGGSPRVESKQLTPAAMLETLSKTSAQAVVIGQGDGQNGALSQAQRLSLSLGNPGADDSDADEGDLGLPGTETVSETSTQGGISRQGGGHQESTLLQAQRLGNPGADDSDADEGDLGLPGMPLSSLQATKPPLVNGNGAKTGAE